MSLEIKDTTELPNAKFVVNKKDNVLGRLSVKPFPISVNISNRLLFDGNINFDVEYINKRRDSTLYVAAFESNIDSDDAQRLLINNANVEKVSTSKTDSFLTETFILDTYIKDATGNVGNASDLSTITDVLLAAKLESTFVYN